MSEEDPLVPANHSRCGNDQPVHKSTRSGSSTSCCYPCKVRKWLSLCLGIFFTIGFLILVPSAISFIVKFISYKKDPNVSQKMTETRSGTYSLLDLVPHFSACAEARLSLELVDAQSSVEVHEVPCDTIPMSQSPVHIPYNRVELTGVPYTLFSHNRSPNNYFVNGTLQVDMVNVTLTNSSSSVVDLCFFTKSEKYEKFSEAGLDWKDFIKDASCERVTLHGGEHNQSLSFNITSPSFIFLGIASEDMLEIDVDLIVMGYTIDGFGNQSVDSYQLNGDNAECAFNASARSKQNMCIVAHQEADATGSYYYSSIEITQTNRADVCATIDILGSIALGSLVFLLTIIVISVIVVIKWKCKSKRNDSTVNSESLVDTCTAAGNINSEEEGTGTATGGQSDTAASVSTPEESDHATNASTLVCTGSSKLPFSSRPSTVEDVSEASKTNIPVQATVQGPDLNSELPSRSTENISDSRFSYGHPETLSD